MRSFFKPDLEPKVGSKHPVPAELRGEPVGLSEEVMELRAATIFELGLMMEIDLNDAFKRLLNYAAVNFNVLRQNFANENPCFNGVDLTGKELKGFNFSGVSFAGVKLEGACFVDCDLTGAIWEGAIGKPALISNCKMDVVAEVGGKEEVWPMVAPFRGDIDASLGWDVK